MAICAYTLFDTYEGRLTPEDLQLVAATVARMESWVRLTPQEVAAYLNAVLDRRSLEQVFDGQTAVNLTFIITGSLLAASPKIGKDEWWFNYLDRVEAAIEATHQ